MWTRCGEKRTLVHCWCECKLTQLLWKLVWRILKKSKLELPHHLVISCWGIYSKESKSGSQRNIYNPTFTAVWFTTKIYIQPTCSLKDEWIKKFTAHITSSLKKEGNPAFCNIIDEPGGHYVKWTRHRKTNTARSQVLLKSKIVNLIKAVLPVAEGRGKWKDEERVQRDNYTRSIN